MVMLFLVIGSLGLLVHSVLDKKMVRHTNYKHLEPVAMVGPIDLIL